MNDRVFIDTAPLISLFECGDKFNRAVYHQLENRFDSNAVLLTSVLTLSELLVHPKQEQLSGLERKYKYLLKELLSEPLVVIKETITDRAACFRADYKISTPDALQLTSAIESGCDIFTQMITSSTG